MNVGKRIQTLRKLKNISGAKLADLIDVSQAQISRYETGQNEVPLSILESICSVLGVTLAEFFSEEVPDLPSDVRQLLQEAKKLTPEQRKKLIEFIRTISD